jgi:ribosomal protein S18 acetylase RimI-like enzyme
METDDLRGARPGARHDVLIVPFGPTHVNEVARLHIDSLSGLLSSLGLAAVRAYYSGASRAAETRAFIAFDGEHPVGFVIGSAHPAELRRQIAHENRAALFTGVLRGLARRPHLLRWLVRSRKGPDERSYYTHAPELIYLAVSSRNRRRGTGRLLVDAFSQAMRTLGVSAYELSVDETNAVAIAFYEKLCFQSTGHYREFGVLHRRYRLEPIQAREPSP